MTTETTDIELKKPKAKKTVMYIGKFAPFHKGHQSIVRRLLSDGYRVIIYLMGCEPFSMNTKIQIINDTFTRHLSKEHQENITYQGDINKISYVVRGRECGWETLDINISDELAEVSSTKISSIKVFSSFFVWTYHGYNNIKSFSVAVSCELCTIAIAP